MNPLITKPDKDYTNAFGLILIPIIVFDGVCALTIYQYLQLAFPQLPSLSDGYSNHPFLEFGIFIGILLLHTSIIFRKLDWWLIKFEKFDKLSKGKNRLYSFYVLMFLIALGIAFYISSKELTMRDEKVSSIIGKSLALIPRSI